MSASCLLNGNCERERSPRRVHCEERIEEAAGLRSEAEVASQTLCAGALAADVAAHGETAVRDAVRAALVSVLSRAYGVRGADGRHAKARAIG